MIYPHHTQLNLNIAGADISGSPLNQSHGNILLLLPSCRRARVSGRRPRNHVSPYRQLSNTIVGKQHAEIND